jgi:hypothetical protein
MSEKKQFSGPVGQIYQLWYEDQMLSEDNSMLELLLFAKEQIEDGAWDISPRQFHKIILRRTEDMEFSFADWLKERRRRGIGK